MLRYTAAATADDDELTTVRLEEGSSTCSLAPELEAEEEDQDAGSTRIMHPPEEHRSGPFSTQLRSQRTKAPALLRAPPPPPPLPSLPFPQGQTMDDAKRSLDGGRSFRRRAYLFLSIPFPFLPVSLVFFFFVTTSCSLLLQFRFQLISRPS
jgi:hypothetical protein